MDDVQRPKGEQLLDELLQLLDRTRGLGPPPMPEGKAKAQADMVIRGLERHRGQALDKHDLLALAREYMDLAHELGERARAMHEAQS